MFTFTAQPIKGIYALAALAIESIRLPIWAFLYVLKFTRPNPRWTLAQALRVRLLRAFLFHAARVEMNIPLSLNPGAEKERFVLLQPADQALYAGPMLLHPEVVAPEKIGGTWYPKLPTDGDLKDQDVILHFHGGAFVLGDGRKQDCGFLASNYIKNAGVNFVFCPQYRLSGSPSNYPFPAALQDALTSYMYLIKERGVSPNRIIIGGDSAGANLALAFLRYIAHLGPKLNIPSPGAAFLWSTWCSLHGSLDPSAAEKSPHSHTDYVSGTFGYWGATRYIPSSLRVDGTAGSVSEATLYISHTGKPFKTDVPLFISWGDCEMLADDDQRLADEFKAVGNRVETFIQKDAPHDIVLVAPILKMEKQAREAAKAAGDWVRKIRGL